MDRPCPVAGIGAHPELHRIDAVLATVLGLARHLDVNSARSSFSAGSFRHHGPGRPAAVAARSSERRAASRVHRSRRGITRRLFEGSSQPLRAPPSSSASCFVHSVSERRARFVDLDRMSCGAAARQAQRGRSLPDARLLQHGGIRNSAIHERLPSTGALRGIGSDAAPGSSVSMTAPANRAASFRLSLQARARGLASCRYRGTTVPREHLALGVGSISVASLSAQHHASHASRRVLPLAGHRVGWTAPTTWRRPDSRLARPHASYRARVGAESSFFGPGRHSLKAGAPAQARPSARQRASEQVSVRAFIDRVRAARVAGHGSRRDGHRAPAGAPWEAGCSLMKPCGAPSGRSDPAQDQVALVPSRRWPRSTSRAG